MKRLSSFAELVLFLLFSSLIPLWTETSVAVPLMVCVTVALSLIFLVMLFRSEKIDPDNKRLRRMKRGCSLLKIGCMAVAAELILLILYFVKTDASPLQKAFSVVMPLLAIGLVLFSGTVRVASSSKQIKLKDHVLMMLLWWCPIVNIFLIRKFYKTAKREFIVESDKIELENARAENEICRTKYPVVMVHGIFFRDWQYLNYWGRVPASLIRNGATVFYGKQQSARAVADCASEVRDTIMKVLGETGAEKVNIIAHSKGGLDSRYAISRLGMDKYVATLTTINTPHKGCDMVDYLLGKLPDGIVQFIARRYNGIFSKLGDKDPDFLAGVHDLSAERAKSYDEEMPDSPEVSYRSYMSVMSSAGSAGFPLNISYLLIKKLNGANDGLVWEESAKHGSYQLVTTPQKRGISHGDVIDLMRENIENYDVREFYVDMVRKLVEEGF